MGTAVRVEVWHEDETVGRAAIDAVMAEMHRIDKLMSTHKEDSELLRSSLCRGLMSSSPTPAVVCTIRRASYADNFSKPAGRHEIVGVRATTPRLSYINQWFMPQIPSVGSEREITSCFN